MSTTNFNIRVSMSFNASSSEMVSVPTTNNPDHDTILAKQLAQEKLREKISQAYLNTDVPVEQEGLEYDLTTITTVIDKQQEQQSSSAYVPMSFQQEPDYYEEDYDEEYDEDYSYTPMSSVTVQSAQDYSALADVLASSSDTTDLKNYIEEVIQKLRRLSEQTR